MMEYWLSMSHLSRHAERGKATYVNGKREMERFSRERQRAILTAAREVFPGEFVCANGIASGSAEEAMADIRYLEGHDLLTVRQPRGISQREWEVSIRITSKGIDFLEDDGGLSAILGVVIIKLHDDTIKELVEVKIRESDLSSSDKQKFSLRLRELPAETTKHLVLKLVEKGLESGPAAIAVIGKFLGSS